MQIRCKSDHHNGRWAAFEVKLGTHRIDDAARVLLKFAQRVDTDRCGEPAALCIIVHDGYAYERADGVAVIPVAALGPQLERIGVVPRTARTPGGPSRRRAERPAPWMENDP